MKWSFRLGVFAGIEVYVHATFLLFLVWILAGSWLHGEPLPVALGGVLFMLSIFACVVLHEFGHALAARRFGIKTRDITLLPIGGVARLERMPEEPLQELWVALAGPLVNVGIAGALYVLIVLAGRALPALHFLVSPEPVRSGGYFLERLLAVNVMLVLFNVIPAFPMDGGRVVRALLATRLDYSRATQIAAGLGQGFALLFGLAGIFWNPMLIFIALFVWIGAEQEASMTQIRSALGGIPVDRAMLTDFKTLEPHDPLERAVELILAASQQDFPVLAGGALVGVLTRSGLLRALAQEGRSGLVESAMERQFKVVESGEMLEQAFLRLQECQCRTLPVVRRGRLLGIITMDNVGEFLAIQAALSGRRKPRIKSIPASDAM